MKKDPTTEALNDLIGEMDKMICGTALSRRKPKAEPKPALADGQSDSEEL